MTAARAEAMPVTEQQRRANVRLALILASIAVLFGVGFFVRMAWFGA